ncbi:MAG: hypothetical protein HOY71_27280 [Nonomuraea sp.]|nr:hypothetical protein [Nonomuraea sp.]
MRRPFSLHLAAGLLAVLWLGLAAGVLLVWRSDAAPFEIFGGVFWTGVWYLWVARVWIGGPMAIRLMRRAMFGICPLLILAGGVAIGMSGGEVYPAQLVGFAAAACGISAAVLLGGREVGAWSETIIRGRVVVQPPDGTAFDLRGAQLRQGRGMFGCLMIVITFAVLLVVGVIGMFLPEGRGTEAPDYIAFMVGVGLVVVIGVAGYIRINRRAAAMGVLVVSDRGINEHPWSRLRSVALVNQGARLVLTFYDEPGEHGLPLPNDAALRRAVADALAARAPEGLVTSS